MRSRIALLLVAAFAVTSTTGCKRIAEKIIKDKISEASDGGVTFNNDGTVTVKGNDTGSSSGSTGSSGTTTTSSFGSGAKLPDGWPSDIPAYPGGKVKSASTSGSERSQTMSAQQETGDAPDAILKFYADKITAAGYKQSSTSESKTDFGVTKSVSFQKGKYGADGSVFLSVSPGFMDKSKNNISLSITSFKK